MHLLAFVFLTQIYIKTLEYLLFSFYKYEYTPYPIMNAHKGNITSRKSMTPPYPSGPPLCDATIDPWII